jgi:C4-type Zn-finger protein
MSNRRQWISQHGGQGTLIITDQRGHSMLAAANAESDTYTYPGR